MARITLSNTDDWQLKFETQDVRGFEALDAKGDKLGATVQDLIVDTDDKRIDAITLSNGTEYPAEHVALGDGVVFLTTINPKGEPSTVRTLWQLDALIPRGVPPV